MFRRILVPVDLSEKNLAALATARDLLRREDGEVLLLHVIETIRDVPFEELAEFYQRIEEKAVEKMSQLVEELAEPELELSRHIVYGSRAREIVEQARSREADLILLTSHRVGPGGPAEGWATLSYQVALLAPCPVLLLK